MFSPERDTPPGRRSRTMNAIKSNPTAQDVMSKEPVCADLSMTIRQLARLFEENEISGCPVLDQEGKVVGVVSKTDLIRRCSEGTRDHPPGYLFEVISDEEDDGPLPDPLVAVEDFMTDEPATVSPATPVAKVAALMVKRRIHRVIVVDEENFPLGVITTLDVLGVFPGMEPKDTAGARRSA
jgi:CBS domain-containing protein